MTFSEKSPAAYHVLIIHEVENYKKRKAIFDDAATKRKEAGEMDYQLLADDTDAFADRTFLTLDLSGCSARIFESPQLVEIRRVAGVRQPQVVYLHDIETGIL